MNIRNIRIIACFSMAFAVIAGAMGAHYLQKYLASEQLASFETAVRYQIIHSLGLLIISNFKNYQNNILLQRATLIMCLGVLLFSGSIYLLSTRSLTGLESTVILGPTTPIGGVLLIAAWFIIAANFIKEKDKN